MKPSVSGYSKAKGKLRYVVSLRCIPSSYVVSTNAVLVVIIEACCRYASFLTGKLIRLKFFCVALCMSHGAR